MKRLLFTVLSLLIAGITARAQDINPNVDPDYEGRDIFVLLNQNENGKGKVVIHQSRELQDAFRNQVYKNSYRKINGYRIRIYSGNSQDARRRSEEIAAGFAANHPGIPVYKSYSNPFFKVTVGDFRTRDEALRFAESIAGRYQSAFLVREPINYPSLW